LFYVNNNTKWAKTGAESRLGNPPGIDCPLPFIPILRRKEGPPDRFASHVLLPFDSRVRPARNPLGPFRPRQRINPYLSYPIGRRSGDASRLFLYRRGVSADRQTRCDVIAEETHRRYLLSPRAVSNTIRLLPRTILYDALYAAGTSGLRDILSDVSFTGRSSPPTTGLADDCYDRVRCGNDRRPLMPAGTMGAGVWGAEEGYKPRTSGEGSSSSTPEEPVRRPFDP